MTLLGTTIVAGSVRAEDLRGEVDALRKNDTTDREAAMLDNLERRAQEVLAAIPRSETAQDADRMRGMLRGMLERSLGTDRLPWPPALRPEIVGTLRRPGYRIEKIIYEALPGMRIPAHLYIPEEINEPAPAILFYNGHWWPDSKARPDFQTFCINMARLGFIVLSFDPFGQGERGISSRDHRRTEALLVGVCQQGFAEYETRCALEYLLTRSEVDPKRIGMTGASGGGYNTWITAALDDRIAAAVPVVGTSEFAEQIRVCRPLDWYNAAEHCHFVPGLIRYANNHELLAMAAPKPVLIVAAVRDESFPVAGVRKVADYGRSLYESYGAAEKFGLVVDESESHGYQRAKREAAYGWFLRWLMGRGDGGPHPEPPTATGPFGSEELRCFPPGRNEPAGPAMIEAVRSLARELPPSSPRFDLGAVLGPLPSAPAARVDVGVERLQRLLIPSEEGLDVPAFLLRPAGEVRGVLVALDDRGKEVLASDPVIETAHSQGWAVCGVDPRGIGESATEKTGWVFAVSLLLGESFVGRQAWDLGRAIEAIGSPGAFPGKPVGLYARGENACLAATYAIARASERGASTLRWNLLRDGFVSYRTFLDRPKSLPASYRLLPQDRDRTTAFDREIPASFFAFDALSRFDFPQLLATTHAEILIVNPRDGDWGRLPEETARGLLPRRIQVVSAEEPDARVVEFLHDVLGQVDGAAGRGAAPDRVGRAAWLRRLDGRVFPRGIEREQEMAGMLARVVQSRVQEANLRESREWDGVKTRHDWEQFREPRLRALRASLGLPPAKDETPRMLVTRTLEGDGYRIENLVFESRPGLVVTANLYQPAKSGESMPGILISHSHHNPKSQGELQDMGMTWARNGCLVLVMDHIGHGERRQHPFRSEADYPGHFRVGRQDYFFRHINGAQLHLVGESLMGWIVGDLIRGLELLLSRPGIDKDRIILLGSVAGGGDPAGVTAALDPRVKAVVPFNFGGPQPDYAVPDNPARNFYWFGVPSWDSTRCLRLGARDGFAHWLIVGSVAPRRLIYAHEFAWDGDRDPAWPRLQKVFGWYDACDHLAAVEGQGTLRGTPPESSHCNNIGAVHRSKIYLVLERWFGMPIPEEYNMRREADELMCLTPDAIREFRPKKLHELAAEAGARRASEALLRLAELSPEERRQQQRRNWGRLLGDIEPVSDPRIRTLEREITEYATVERIVLEVEHGALVPVLLLIPPTGPVARPPVVIGMSQAGKQTFLGERSDATAEWLGGGAAVCLFDVRGTGETRPHDGSRRHDGLLAELSETEWMLGQTLVGSRLRDVRSVLRYLQTRADLDGGRVALWGDSFAPTNPASRALEVPLDADPFPHQAEPLGGLLALFTALFEDGIRAVYVRGGLTGFQSLLEGQVYHVPHDAVIPGAMAAGDLCNVAAALAPCPLRMEGLVDGLNRTVDAVETGKVMEPARSAYQSLGAETSLQLDGGGAGSAPATRWLLGLLLAETVPRLSE
jgi:cephalosporin-C deacetylase-like acetyl esterase